jgi:taurine dioxygenase
VIHPLVRTHPDSGRRGLHPGGKRDSEIIGLPEAEGGALVAEPLAYMTRPEFVREHHRQPGDVLMGDNRCSRHRATAWDEGK